MLNVKLISVLFQIAPKMLSDHSKSKFTCHDIWVGEEGVWAGICCMPQLPFFISWMLRLVVRLWKRILHIFSSNEGVPCVEILESFADCGMQSFYSECAELKVLKYWKSLQIFAKWSRSYKKDVQDEDQGAEDCSPGYSSPWIDSKMLNSE